MLGSFTFFFFSTDELKEVNNESVHKVFTSYCWQLMILKIFLTCRRYFQYTLPFHLQPLLQVHQIEFAMLLLFFRSIIHCTLCSSLLWFFICLFGYLNAEIQHCFLLRMCIWCFSKIWPWYHRIVYLLMKILYDNFWLWKTSEDHFYFLWVDMNQV